MPPAALTVPGNHRTPTAAMRSVVVFGAGSVGRGFIGQIFAEAGWRVVFVDTDPVLVAALRRGDYRHATVSDAGIVTVSITGCTAIDGHDTAAAAKGVAEAGFLVTCVGARNLPHIASTIAAGIQLRHTPVDLMLAENLHDASTVMRTLLAEHLDPQALSRIGLVAASIGRMIPVPTPQQRAADPSWVAVEPYRELPYDVAACVADPPNVPDLVGRPGVPFSFFADRKLYVHNLGHCLTAYLGELLGEPLIDGAIGHAQVRGLVGGVMRASAGALAAEYGQSADELEAHVQDLLLRFANHALRDSVARVGRDPLRKLAPGERFLGALELTKRHDRSRPVEVALAVAVNRLVAKTPGSGVGDFRARLTDPTTFDSALTSLEQGLDLESLNRLAGLTG